MKSLFLICGALMLASSAYAEGDHMGGAGGMNPATPMNSMSCNDMMTKAHAMPMPTDSMKMKTANDEMKMAKTAMAGGDESGCKMHMTNAMNAMGGGM